MSNHKGTTGRACDQQTIIVSIVERERTTAASACRNSAEMVTFLFHIVLTFAKTNLTEIVPLLIILNSLIIL